MGSDWAWGYLAAKRRARRRYQRELTAMEARLRLEMGLPPLAASPAPLSAYQRPRWRRHIGRWVLLAVVVMLLVLLAAFLVYAWGVGVQHGYIYPARHG